MKTDAKIPSFSVIIPTLNEEYYLPKLLHDLSEQTFTDFEVIIVDANSKDKTREKAEKFMGRFKNLLILVSNKKNVSHQRNLGAQKARADWFIFMDADNRIPTYFLQGIKFNVEMLNPDILSTWTEPDTNNKKDKAASVLSNLYIDLQKTSNKPSVLESLLCVKKLSFIKLGGFNEQVQWGEGDELLIKARKNKMKFCFVKYPRYQYSYRRRRKQGTLQLFRRFAELELNRLRDKKLSKEKTKYLYPMEGGEYFVIDKKNKGRMEKIFSMLIKETKSQIKNGQKGVIEKILTKLKNLFSPE